MYVLAAFLALVLVMVVHEFGHLLVLWPKGLVKEVFLGLPVPYLNLSWQCRGVTYRLSPFLIVVGVKPRSLEGQGRLYCLFMVLGGTLFQLVVAVLAPFGVGLVVCRGSLGCAIKTGLFLVTKTFELIILFWGALVRWAPQMVAESTGYIGAMAQLSSIGRQLDSDWKFGFLGVTIALFLLLNALISLAQLIPFPPFDGWQVLVVLIGPSLNQRGRTAVRKSTIVGAVVILGGMVLLTVRDLVRIVFR